MEKWQKEQIKRNLPNLIKFTSCHVHLLAIHQAKGVLSDDEVERIEAKDNKTSRQSAQLLYKILLSRQNAYDILTEALIETKQSGAASILLKIPTDKLANLQVRFLDRAYRVKELLNREQIKSVHKWLQTNLSANECQNIIDNQLASEAPLELIRNTIPPPDPLYVPGFLTRRLNINPALFHEKCADIFVFSGVNSHRQLRPFVNSVRIETSTQQLHNRLLNCRFILLEESSHWERICAVATVSVHLIRFDAVTKDFVLEATSGRTDVLDKNLPQNKNSKLEKYISEENFLTTALGPLERGICVCDTAGMGKSLLLANLARKIQLLCPDRLVALIQLRNFCLPENGTHAKKSEILKCIATSAMAYRILEEILANRSTKYELFFDGLDELPEENLQATMKYIQNIFKEVPEASIYITARPVARKELEQTVKAISYDMQPFDKTTQKKFLVSVWLRNKLSDDSKCLEYYASTTLRKFRESLQAEESQITGVPLQCKLIAEVFSDEVEYRTYLHDRENSYCIVSNLVDIYDKFFSRQLGENHCNSGCSGNSYGLDTLCANTSCQIKRFHVWQALLYIFPKQEKILSRLEKSFTHLSLQQKTKAAILVPCISSDFSSNLQSPSKLDFAHRTFAEYLVAKYMQSSVMSASPEHPNGKIVSKITQTIFNQLGLDIEPVITYFLNSVLKSICQNPDSFSSAKLSLAEKTFKALVKTCLCKKYVVFLELLLAAKQNSAGVFKYFPKMIRRVDRAFAENCVEGARTALLLETIVSFFRQYYDADLFKLVDKRVLIDQIVCFARHGNYETALLIVDKVSLLNYQVLYRILSFSRYTEIETGTTIQEILDVVNLLLGKCKGLLEESWPGNGESCLISQLPHVEVVKFFVQNGANILARNSENRNIFHYFVEKHTDLEFYQLFCFFLNWCCSATLQEVGNETEESLKRLVLNYLKTLPQESNLLVEYKEAFVQLFRNAVQSGDIEVTTQLLNLDATLLEANYDKGKPPIFAAVWGEQETMLEFLVSKGANIFAVDEDHATILHKAAMGRHMTMFVFVVKLLGKIWDQDNLHSNATFLANVEFVEETSTPKNIRELFNWKMKPCNSTVLHIIVDKPSYVCTVKKINLLLTCGRASELSSNTVSDLDLNAKDCNGKTALMKNLYWAKTLVNAGASLDVKDNCGCNLAHISACAGNTEALDYFVGLGVDINELDFKGNNGMQCALRKDKLFGSWECLVVQNCLDAGANKEHCNLDGDTAYDILLKKNHSKETRQLLEVNNK